MLEDERFEFVLNRVATATNLALINQIISEICGIYSLSNIVYHLLNAPNDGNSDILLLTYEQQWVSRYFQRDYFQIDPVVKAGARAFLPIDWRDVDRNSIEAQRFFAESVNYGVGRQGVSLPIRGTMGESALFTITSNAADTDWRNVRRLCMRDFQMIGHYVHDQVVRIAGIQIAEKTRPLSSRERECLELVGRGRTIKQISGTLSISETAIRLYLHSARRKLNTVTIPQALSVAVKNHLIDI